MSRSKAGGKQHGVKGRIVGPAVRDNGLKAGAHTADLYSARRYASNLMACLNSLGLPAAPADPDQVAPAAAPTTAEAGRSV